jgi:CubicO group peptidase (beta-lactamase class C family)
VAGKPVIEMYAGYADEEKTKPYTKDNLNIVHSSGKAVMSLTIAHLVGEGKLDYDEKVSKYWPEFAAGNKGDVTLGQLCAHSGGVSWWAISFSESPSLATYFIRGFLRLDKEFMPTVEDIQMGNQDALEKKIAGQPHNQGGTTTKSYHG